MAVDPDNRKDTCGNKTGQDNILERSKTNKCAGVTMKIPDEMLNILYGNYFGYVCTSDRNDQPHITPVFFVYEEPLQKIFFITNDMSKRSRIY